MTSERAGKERIGVIGLGKMGGGIARTLLRNGYSIVVYDINELAVKSLTELGAERADSPKDLAKKVDIVISSLPGPREVEQVFLGENGFLEGAKRGQIIIDMSTTNPESTRKIAKEALKLGVEMLDAPVSGSPKMALEGSLTLMVGGSKEAYEKCKRIFESLGKTIHYIGDVGSGHTVKLINNIMSAGNVLVAAEAFILGVKAGVDPSILYNVLSTGRGRSVHFVERFPKVLRGDFQPGFTLGFAHKDLELALELGKAVNMPLPITGLMYQIYTMAKAMGLSDEDFVSVIKIFEEWAGVKARAKEINP
jgi:3-hydroxyisobutyrate dehydrogenase